MMFNLGRRALLLVYSLLIIVPLLVVVFGSVKTQPELFGDPFLPTTDPQVGNYSNALLNQGIGQAMLNSSIVTASSVTLTLALGSLAAYGIARIPGWKGGLIFGFLILGMAIPAQANMIPQRVLFDSLGLLDTRLGLVLINITITLPVATFIMGGFMKTLPRSMFEASSIDGAGPFRTYLRIALPLSAPSIAATAIFLFVIHWNDLLYPLLFIQSPSKRTLPLALLNFQGEFLTNYPLLFTGVVIASLPVVVAYIFLQRYFVAGMTAGATKG